jgi:hypothetical protein
MHHLSQIIKNHSFLEIFIPQRSGLPDEARPTILLELSSGKSLIVSKWANDRYEDFDAVYHKLLEVVESSKTTKPIFEGKYDPQWKPPEFVLP